MDKRVLWPPGHNAINVYSVVVPWRREVSFEEMGSGRPYLRQDRLNNKGDIRCHPKGQTDRKIPCKPARLCTEQEASSWLTPGTLPWYFAQGLTPPSEEAIKRQPKRLLRGGLSGKSVDIWAAPDSRVGRVGFGACGHGGAL